MPSRKQCKVCGQFLKAKAEVDTCARCGVKSFSLSLGLARAGVDLRDVKEK